MLKGVIQYCVFTADNLICFKCEKVYKIELLLCVMTNNRQQTPDDRGKTTEERRQRKDDNDGTFY